MSWSGSPGLDAPIVPSSLGSAPCSPPSAGQPIYLVSLGAIVLNEDIDITVLADPEGNEFCVE